MSATASTVVVKDGNGTAVSGGVRSIDESGSGSGPFKPVSAIMDGSGVASALAISSAGAASVNPTLQSAPVAPGSATATKSVLGGAQYNASGVAPSDGQQHSIQSDPAGAQTVGGAAAHGAAIAGNPVRQGLRAVTANPTAVTTGQTVDHLGTLVGAAVQKPYSIPEADWAYPAASGGIDNTTTAVTIKAAGAAGLRNYITWIDVSSEALGTATEIAIRDGAAGTVLWRMKIGTGGLVGGRFIAFPTPLKGTAATLLEVVTLTAASTGKVYVNVGGYVAP